MGRLPLPTDARRRTTAACVAAILMATTSPWHAAEGDVADQDALAAIQNFLGRQRTAHQYTAWRRLEASGSGHRAWLDVQTDFSAESGLFYEVTAEGGSGYIRSRVLRSLLNEEQRLIALRGESGVALTTDNYQFVPEGINEQ